MIDVHGADIARFYPEERPDEHIWARSAEHFNKTYGIVHPAEQWESRRNLRVGPYFSRQEDLGSVFFQARTWERPQWFESNADLVERYGVEDREVEWDARWCEPRSPSPSTSTCGRTAGWSISAPSRSTS